MLATGIQKSREFLKFVRLLAGRVGELLDYSNLGTDAGVDSKTTKEWVSILERMHIIAFALPFSSDLSSGLIKSPKVYFIDTGLACRFIIINYCVRRFILQPKGRVSETGAARPARMASIASSA